MKYLLLLLICIPLFSFSQEYSGIVDVPGKNITQLHSSAKEWLALTFKSANSIIQLDDTTSHKVVGNGNCSVNESYYSSGLVEIPCNRIWNIDFIILIALKDNKYKATISDLIINDASQVGSGFTKIEPKPYSNYLDQKDFYKNESNPETAKYKNTCNISKAYLNIMDKTDAQMNLILQSLETKMKSVDANW